MSTGRLLVVAPDADVRRSLVFALEAEGYEVGIRADLPAAPWLSTHPFDCAVLDQRAVRPCDREVLSDTLASAPVVLLAYRPQPWLTDKVSAIVETPALEGAMVAAVEHALHRH